MVGAAAVVAPAAGAAVESSSKTAESSTKVLEKSNQPAGNLQLKDLPACTTKYEYSACVYGVNNTQFFSAPNTLAGGAYRLSRDTYNLGTGHIDWWWPVIWPGGSQAQCPNSGPQYAPTNPWCLQAGDGDAGTMSMAVYTSPTDADGNTALPPWDKLYVSYEVLDGERNRGNCGYSPDLQTGSSSNYTQCPTNTPQFEGGNNPNFIFTIQNQPLTVQILNNLPAGNDLQL